MLDEQKIRRFVRLACAGISTLYLTALLFVYTLCIP